MITNLCEQFVKTFLVWLTCLYTALRRNVKTKGQAFFFPAFLHSDQTGLSNFNLFLHQVVLVSHFSRFSLVLYLHKYFHVYTQKLRYGISLYFASDDRFQTIHSIDKIKESRYIALSVVSGPI